MATLAYGIDANIHYLWGWRYNWGGRFDRLSDRKVRNGVKVGRLSERREQLYLYYINRYGREDFPKVAGRREPSIKNKKEFELNMKTGNRFLAVMRRGLASVVSIIMTIGVSGNCLAQTQGEKKSRLLTFERTVHDFGEITHEDGVQECSFKYKNQTDTTILIYDVKVFCNCTKVEWPRKPIKPGEEGEIKVKYDNEGTPHHFDKGVSVYTSTGKRPILLRIKGTVTE